MKKAVVIYFILFMISLAIGEVSIIAFYFLLLITSIIVGLKNKKKEANNESVVPIKITNAMAKSDLVIKCVKCGTELSINDMFCGNCGAAFDGNNVTVEEGTPTLPVFVTQANYDSILSLNEYETVKTFIERELKKAGLDLNTKLIPQDLYKRKKILSIIFCVLVFIYVGMIFFHFPFSTYFIGLIILLVMFFKTRSYNLLAFITKEIKARPDEKVYNIIMNIKNTLVVNNLNKIRLIGSIIAIILPLIIFFKPVIIYEQNENNYGVRYYIYGLTNFTSATIPEKHNGKDVVSLRGNTFSNMYFLKKVILPDTITEIRGEAFYNCYSLESVNLPQKITEIKGSTFENCKNLKKINIPDSVIRIGGHAFYGNSSLEEVSISENSKLREIGSSAFRMCSSLKEIYIPQGVYVNERAFKESPTTILEYGSYKLSYNYHTYLYITEGYKKEINEFHKNAKVQDAYIELVNINRVNGNSEFGIRYVSNTQEKDFVLSYYDRKKQINDDLVVEISNDYVFDYYDKVSLDIYYN